MRMLLWSLLAGAILVVIRAESREADQTVFAHGLEGVASQSALVAHVTAAGDRQVSITVVDPLAKKLAVYEYGIGPQAGRIVLKSVRDIGWDLRLKEYRSDGPTSEEIRGLLGESSPAHDVAR